MRPQPARSLRVAWVAALALAAPLAQADGHLLPDRFYDPADGQFDLSDWLLKQKGFLPVPVIVTEPAVGYGAGLFAAFFRQSIDELSSRAREDGRLQPPDIYVLGAAATENGTKVGAAGGMVKFDDDRYRWRGAVARTHVNLEFAGIGGRLPAVGYTLDGWISVQQGMMRLGRSDAWLVARWNWFDLGSSFDTGADPTALGGIEKRSKVSGLGLSLEYDSRDNIFTPNRGWTGALDLTFHDPAWGSDTRFQLYRANAFGYWPASRELVVGGRVDLRAANGDVPFYMLPFVDLRGVPVLRIQDTRTAVLEAELRWNVRPRWALIGFLGGGRAWGRGGSFADGNDTIAKGAGFRYKLAAAMGLWAGIDWAWSQQGQAVYLQIGNAWR